MPQASGFASSSTAAGADKSLDFFVLSKSSPFRLSRRSPLFGMGGAAAGTSLLRFLPNFFLDDMASCLGRDVGKRRGSYL